MSETPFTQTGYKGTPCITDDSVPDDELYILSSSAGWGYSFPPYGLREGPYTYYTGQNRSDYPTLRSPAIEGQGKIPTEHLDRAKALIEALRKAEIRVCQILPAQGRKLAVPRSSATELEADCDAPIDCCALEADSMLEALHWRTLERTRCSKNLYDPTVVPLSAAGIGCRLSLPFEFVPLVSVVFYKQVRCLST